MSARKSKQRFTVTRDDGQKVVTWRGLSEFEARRVVAWCGTDNLQLNRGEATYHANGVVVGEPYQLGHYRFLIEHAADGKS